MNLSAKSLGLGFGLLAATLPPPALVEKVRLAMEVKGANGGAE